MLRAIAVLLILWPASSFAWNGLGHKVIADIAWQHLDDEQRAEIVRTLRRHPRFDDDFIKRRRETVTDEDRWIFQHAATWPDLARGLPGGERGKYDRATWHYVNLPVFLGSLWDNLLGRQDRMQDVAREVAELQQQGGQFDVTDDVPLWIDESRQLAESFVYDSTIREAVEAPGDLPPIELPEAYLREAGEHARRRIRMAGLRLGALLGEAGR